MKKIRKLPLVSLVGAGPGDEELITVKGLKAIQQADVIIYDALVNKALLKYAPDTCQFIYVGKRGGQRSTPQEVINEYLVQAAQHHGHVVRLKGGDPFVFGRGYEEVEYLEQHNIPVHLIPGISSCIDVPEMEKVPVTSRGVARSFWVLTATTSTDALANDLFWAMKSSATVVILMGRRKLPQIANIYLKNGRADTPVMVVQNGTMKTRKKKVVGTMKNIVEQVEAAELGAPCIIVVGDVVGLHHQEVLELQLEQLHKQKQRVI